MKFDETPKKPDDEDDENYVDDDTPAKTIKKSTTDPDSGFMHRDGKPHSANVLIFYAFCAKFFVP